MHHNIFRERTRYTPLIVDAIFCVIIFYIFYTYSVNYIIIFLYSVNYF